MGGILKKNYCRELRIGKGVTLLAAGRTYCLKLI